MSAEEKDCGCYLENAWDNDAERNTSNCKYPATLATIAERDEQIAQMKTYIHELTLLVAENYQEWFVTAMGKGFTETADLRAKIQLLRDGLSELFDTRPWSDERDRAMNRLRVLRERC